MATGNEPYPELLERITARRAEARRLQQAVRAGLSKAKHGVVFNAVVRQDGLMMEISPLAGPDRAEWEALARKYMTFCGNEISDQCFDQAWRRLLDAGPIRGIAARIGGKLVGFAHYGFEPTVWAAYSCHLQDLFVAPENRRQGVARALIEWLAGDAEEYGAVSLHWLTPQDNVGARALYDEVASFKGFIAYSRKLGGAPSADAEPAASWA
ncbi:MULTISPECIES: GNAT family N-acetyltransferase [unclassified Streptomyces]|uniref:GNAT family N-acetyltransferase n=1 Tax=unclassified Streptomyces TaxID=2593676 RepID=UPI001F37FCC5|nr:MULTISPECIES: GNAT family N-acetyltransferase [unclassified Streptomyces]